MDLLFHASPLEMFSVNYKAGSEKMCNNVYFTSLTDVVSGIPHVVDIIFHTQICFYCYGQNR